jgi:hypothetical protein
VKSGLFLRQNQADRADVPTPIFGNGHQRSVKASSDGESESTPCEGMVLEIMKIMLTFFQTRRGRVLPWPGRLHVHLDATQRGLVRPI